MRLTDIMHEPNPERIKRPIINFIGIGADDPHSAYDAAALGKLIGPDFELGCIIAHCTVEEIENASNASLNIVFGRGKLLAKKMKERFDIPYEVIDYPYGLTGAEEVWNCLETHFGVDVGDRRNEFIKHTADGLAPVYQFIKSFYGMPVAVIGTGARCRGMTRFLIQELGFEVVCSRVREEINDMEDVIEEIENSDAAVVFGSSFEGEISDKLNIPAFYFDYPVLRRICITDRPYIGDVGTIHLVEDLVNELMAYQSPQNGAVSKSCGM